MIFSEVRRTASDPAFFAPLRSLLGASPIAVLRHGACCSGIHRLFITSLDAIGIRAAQITVFRQSEPAAAHCLAQVSVEAENLIIDVDYGVWYRHPRGGALDLRVLRSCVTPVIERFTTAEARYADSVRTRPAGYPDCYYYRFDYYLTRTANWAETAWKQLLYAVLHPLTRGRVDYMRLPAVLEWPEGLVSAAFCAAGLLLLAVGSRAPV